MYSRLLISVVRLLPLWLGLAILVATLPTSVRAQAAAPSQSSATAAQPAQPEVVHLKDYSKPRSAFPNVLQPYKSQEIAPPNLGNSPRIDSLMKDGKIYLSIDDAVALALENNLDLDLARYNLNIADADLLRAKSGSSILGVNTGIVQNTPGGGVGGLGGTVGSGTGGTTVAAGGAGSGTNGLVSSTLGIGSPLTSFDPVLSSNLQLDKNNTESTSPFSPVPILSQNTYTADVGYSQAFQFGGLLSGSFNNTHLTTNSTTSLLTPQLGSNFQLRFSQNLLQGFGFLPNTRFIRIAKNNREISDVAFRLQIITTVDQIENMYWDLVYAFENVRVQQEALTYSQKALEDAKRQAQVGTAPPIQAVSAQSTVATGQQNLIVAQNNLQLQQLLMKNALSRSIEDPVLAEADLIPTSTVQLPQQEPAIPIQDLINDALQHRAELVETRIDLNSRDINNKAVRNAMLPTLSAFAYYGGSGVGGSVNPECVFGGTPCSSLATLPPRISEYELRWLWLHAQPTGQRNGSRQGRRTLVEYSPSQPAGSIQSGARTARIPASAGATTSAGKSGADRGPQRPVRREAESCRGRSCAIGSGSGEANARCRSTEIARWTDDANHHPARRSNAYHRRIEPGVSESGLREIED